MNKRKITRLSLPKMLLVRQCPEVPSAIDMERELELEFERIKGNLRVTGGDRIAIGVGSRGIHQLPKIVRKVVSILKEAGARPFIMPAMGSHGGATAIGQLEILRSRGITEEYCSAPMKADMDVKRLGKSKEGMNLFLSRLACEADGIVLINRIKPHTNFIGATESGLLKMMAIGLGNQVGAEQCHRWSLKNGMQSVISDAGQGLIELTKFLFGVALLQNQRGEICTVKLALKDDVLNVEKKLLVKARSILPTLPLEEIDLLIVDEMGKNISGQGMDPCVVGRDCVAYGVNRNKPRISRIFVRDLTEASNGSALGIGAADFALERLVKKVNIEETAINCLTACCPEAGRIPLAFPTDVMAIQAALATVRPWQTNDLGIVHIKNTLDLEQILVSEAYMGVLGNSEGIRVEARDIEFKFGNDGMLISAFSV